MKRKRLVNLIILFICIISITVIITNKVFGSNTVKGASDTPIKYYQTITIEKNDTLWDIAEKYMDTNYYDYNSYMDELISINNIQNSIIYSGESIIVPIIQYD